MGSRFRSFQEVASDHGSLSLWGLLSASCSCSACGFQVIRPDGFPHLADIVLCSDCVCEPAYGETWEDLVETIESILSPDGHAIISLRRRSYDGIDGFVQRLARNLRFQRFRHRKSNPENADGIDLICARWPGKREQFEDSVDSPRNPRETEFAAMCMQGFED